MSLLEMGDYKITRLLDCCALDRIWSSTRRLEDLDWFGPENALRPVWGVVFVAEPLELSRLKCAGHHYKGNTDSNALQTEQFLVCRVTSRYNHRISDRTSIPRTKVSPEILPPQILQHRHNSYYSKF